MKNVVLIILSALLFAQCDTPATDGTTTKSDNTPKITQIGQTLKTEYFDVTVNSAKFYKSVKAQEGMIDFQEDQAVRYLLLNVTFKNTDTESRTLFDGGPILINFNNKDYSFDQPETTIAEGWGIFLEAINPMLSKTTFLVYKIPKEIKGDFYWRPNRADNDQKIFLLKAI